MTGNASVSCLNGIRAEGQNADVGFNLVALQPFENMGISALLDDSVIHHNTVSDVSGTGISATTTRSRTTSCGEP